jgi:hypothetical protein
MERKMSRFKCNACGAIVEAAELPTEWVTVSAEVTRPSDKRRVTTPCMPDQACSMRCAADLLRQVARVADEVGAGQWPSPNAPTVEQLESFMRGFDGKENDGTDWYEHGARAAREAKK